MYDQSKLSELIRFARVDAGSTVIDVYPGDGDWTVSSPTSWDPKDGSTSFVPAEVAHFKNDPVGRMRTLAKEPGRETLKPSRRTSWRCRRSRSQRMSYGCTCSTTISTQR